MMLVFELNNFGKLRTYGRLLCEDLSIGHEFSLANYSKFNKHAKGRVFLV